MLQSISKYKLYLYLVFFVFLSSIFNFEIFRNYKDKFSLKTININGLSGKENEALLNELVFFKNTNIFNLDQEKILKKLYKFNYLENIYVKRIIPSSLNVNISKTQILGLTQRNGKIFYIGKNEKFINSNQLFDVKDVPILFGNFEIKQFLNLLNILNINHINLNEIEKYFYYKNKRWDLQFSDGLTIKLPSKNIEKSLKIYKKLLKDNNLVNIKIIDLRVANQIILTNYDE